MAKGSKRPDFRVTKFTGFVSSNFNEELNLDRVAREFGINKSYLCRKFIELYGITPMRAIWGYRVARSVEMIAHDRCRSIVEIASACGFQSPSHFNRHFRDHVGTSPSQFRAYGTMQTGPKFVELKSFIELFKRVQPTGPLH